MVALDWFIQRDLQVCLTTTRIIACVVSALHSLIHWGHEGVICCLTVWNYTDYFHCSLSQHFSSSWLLVQHWELGQDSMFSRTSRPLPSLPLTPPHYYIPSHCMVARFGKPLSAPPAFPLFLLMSGLFLRLLRGAFTHCGHIELQPTQRFSPVWNDEMTFNAECFLNQLVSTCRHWHKDL